MEYRINRLGHQGDGIADGPVYAPLTLPGEVVTGRLEGERLQDIRIVTPSEDRVKPPCRHFKSCGGCQVMHASDDFVAAWKTDVIRRALEAQGIAAPMRPILTSPEQSRRRAGFAARRTKSGALVGFHGRASDTIVEIPDCRLIAPALREGIEVARDAALCGGSRKAVLSVLVSDSLEGLDVAVTGGKPLDQALLTELAALTERHRLARLTWDGEGIAMRAAPTIAVGAARISPPPGAFLQATEHGQASLISAMREALSGASSVVDLFAGCGTFSLPLAQSAEVHAVESEAAMLQALDLGWRHASGVKKVTTEVRDLFRNPILPEDLKGFDGVVIDPPRAGAEAQCQKLALAQIPRIGFVSCNPVTFARDAKVLIDGGYDMLWVQAVDQFRWSTHVELAASFRLSHM
ncbi:class I SAM-dependent RNA methyltransferase [Primorskyibacter sp. S187A]|uniref:class I SAM-dependent RNA methyltransferase n=1 Tax=Primorskyibacter sp. S187A TaxID=3415130 RepID=UPI003C7DCE3A